MKHILFLFVLSISLGSAAWANNVLVTIGASGQVTQQQLESAMQAAPFATQFPAMDEQDQAYLRGDMLLRLARAEALYQEAVASGIQHSEIFQQEMGNFKTALLAQKYLQKLSKSIRIPAQDLQAIEDKIGGQSDAIEAAKSAYIAKNFKTLKAQRIHELRQQAGVQTYFQLLDEQPQADSVLAQGQNIRITYADLLGKDTKVKIDKQRIIDKVNEWIDLTLMAYAASQTNTEIEAQLADYGKDLTTRLLLAQKEQDWLQDEAVLRHYFQQHPEIAYVPERRQIGQLVVADQQQAMQLRERILKGESLFELAAQFSIDPYGRQRSGDMGWLAEGSGLPEIELAIKNLPDNQVSEVTKTAKGWHVVMIVNRKLGERKHFAAIKDRVKQKFIAQKMTDYLREVTEKYPLQWHIANLEKSQHGSALR